MRLRRAPLAVALGLLSLGAPAAHADHTGYRGGCRFQTVNDTTPDGTLGGQNQWNGAIEVVVVATDAAGVPAPYPISIECELLINGNSQGVVASATGTGFAVGGGQFSVTAEATDVVTLCDNVLVDGEPHQNCADATTTQIVPQPVNDVLDTVPTSHKVTAACSAHVNRALGIATVSGRAKAGPHGNVDWTHIRCYVYSETGVLLFNEAQTTSGDTAELDRVFAYRGSANALRACAYGEAHWADNHSASDYPPC